MKRFGLAFFLGTLILSPGCFHLVRMGAGEPGVLQETWMGVSGERVTDLTENARYGEPPDETRRLTAFATETAADQYGSRYRALLHPQATGEYTFWLASDDGGELWLSSDERADNGRRIATVTGWTGRNEWDRQPGQRSQPILLEAGRAYHMMALHKEGGGGDHLSVAWQGPGIERRIVPGDVLTLPELAPEERARLNETERADRRRRKRAERVVAFQRRGETLPLEMSSLFSVSGEGAPPDDTGINVLIDQAHQTSFVVLWGLRGQVRGQGFRACSSVASLSSVLTPGSPSRVRTRAAGMEPFAWWPTAEFNVVISSQQDPNAQDYTPEERQALRRFIEQGGGLLLIGAVPKDEAAAEAWSMNRLAGEYGARFLAGGEKLGGRSCSAFEASDEWEVLERGEGGRPVRVRRKAGRGRIMILENRAAILPNKKKDSEEAKAAKNGFLRDTLNWLAAGKDPVGGDWRLPHRGGVGIFPELESNLGGVVVYYAANQKPAVLTCIRKDIPEAAEQLRAWFPSKVFDEPYTIVICAGGGGGWAINARPKAAAVISYNPEGIVGIFAHEMAHTMGGPRNAKGELAGISPHGNQGESHAGWFQGKITARYTGKTDQSNRNCNRILAREKQMGERIDLANFDREKWGKGADWTKHWYVFQKLDDRYGPTWYPRWYWVRAVRWADEPGRRETWDELVEDMSIAVGEDLFPFFRRIGTSLQTERLEEIEFRGRLLRLPAAPLDDGPGGKVCLAPVGDYRKPLSRP